MFSSEILSLEPGILFENSVAYLLQSQSDGFRTIVMDPVEPRCHDLHAFLSEGPRVHPFERWFRPCK